MQKRIHYIYDIIHNVLEINEHFTSIFNSGQIWKFASTSMPEWKGTNLVFIQKYFGNLEEGGYYMTRFRTWINCNTISDFKEIKYGLLFL